MPTKIPWADETWPVVTGCTHAGGPGCDNCYGARMAATRLRDHPRYKGLAYYHNGKARWTGKVNLNYDVLEQPLHFRKPRMIFVASMGDWLHPDVSESFVYRILDITQKTPQHIYQFLTKRANRLPVIIKDWMLDRGLREPPRNVWQGVSVEDQVTADERILLLLQTPAAVRFVSCEPLLGPIDISPYLGYNIQKGEMGNGQRAGSLQFSTVWGVEDRPGWTSLDEKEKWLETGRTQNAIGLSPGQKNDQQYKDSHRGASASLPALQGSNSSRHNDQPPKWTEGRQQTRESGASDLLREHETCVHDWPEKSRRPEESRQQADRSTGEGNQGEIRTGQRDPERIRNGVQRYFPDYIKDREGRTPSGPGRSDSRLHATPDEREQTPKPQRAIHLVIVGGESGPGARPMHPDWARSLRDQCQASGTPFFFKQWGEYLGIDYMDRRAGNMPVWTRADGLSGPIGKRPEVDFGDGHGAVRIGRKRAGRLLDGQVWDQFPVSAPRQP